MAVEAERQDDGYQAQRRVDQQRSHFPSPFFRRIAAIMSLIPKTASPRRLAAGLGLLLTACSTTVYKPESAAVSDLGAAQARELVQKQMADSFPFTDAQLAAAHNCRFYAAPNTVFALVEDGKRVADWHVRLRGGNLVLRIVKQGAPSNFSFALRGLNPDEEYEGDTQYIRLFGVRKLPYFSCSFASGQSQDMRHAVLALAALQREAQTQPTPEEQLAEQEQRFETAAQNYGASDIKPGLPEDARRLGEQAAQDMDSQDYDDAVDLYEQALEVAPWWPEFHYQRGLALAAVNDYAEAVAEMQRYLLLDASGSEAAAAQAKAGEWGRKAQ
jgi:tetratricopeptide (TPR) repeat protein